MLGAQVNRPLTMKKDGIQTRKRKPKNPINVLQANALLKADVKGAYVCVAAAAALSAAAPFDASPIWSVAARVTPPPSPAPSSPTTNESTDDSPSA